MIGYASRTGTLKNLAALRAAGWRLIVSPTGKLRHHGFRYGLENGAWTAYSQGLAFNQVRFMRAVERLGAGADWIVIPDIVAGGLRSLEFSLSWRERLAGIAPLLLLPVQDGMTPPDVQLLVGPQLGLFVGGTTEFKLSTMAQWGRLAQSSGCWLHIGRVNTARRIHLCAAAGATSFDGTSASRYVATLPLLDNAARQPDFRF
jgi:hypothetical protein